MLDVRSPVQLESAREPHETALLLCIVNLPDTIFRFVLFLWAFAPLI